MELETEDLNTDSRDDQRDDSFAELVKQRMKDPDVPKTQAADHQSFAGEGQWLGVVDQVKRERVWRRPLSAIQSPTRKPRRFPA